MIFLKNTEHREVNTTPVPTLPEKYIIQPLNWYWYFFKIYWKKKWGCTRHISCVLASTDILTDIIKKLKNVI